MVFCGEKCEKLQRKGHSPPLLQNRCYTMWHFQFFSQIQRKVLKSQRRNFKNREEESETLKFKKFFRKDFARESYSDRFEKVSVIFVKSEFL